MKRLELLEWSNVLAKYSLWVMQAYLTDVWKISFTNAAAIMNVFTGLVAILPIAMIFLAKKYIGHYRMLQLTSIAYCVGFGCLAMSTPPVLAKATSTCSEYEPACIGKVQSILFYIALSLIAVGMSGQSSSLESTIKERRKTEGIAEETITHSRCCVYLGSCVVGTVLLVGVDAIPFLKPWAVRFGVPAIVTLVVTLFFLSESCCPTPTQRSDLPNELLPHTRNHRCETRNLRLSSKLMIPILMSFIVCGVVISIGNTYFVEQANHMNRKVGRLTFPLQIFLLYCDMQKSRTETFSESSRSEILGTILSIPCGMLSGILCCITAAWVETRRIEVIKKHGLIDKPDDTIPMTIFWLLPQFILLGRLDNTVRFGIEEFFGSQVPDSMRTYTVLFTEGVLGAGIVASVLSIYISSKVSELGGRPSWFQYTLNKSCLYNYYWTLAVLISISFVCSCVFTPTYIKECIKETTESQNDDSVAG